MLKFRGHSSSQVHHSTQAQKDLAFERSIFDMDLFAQEIARAAEVLDVRLDSEELAVYAQMEAERLGLVGRGAR